MELMRELRRPERYISGINEGMNAETTGIAGNAGIITVEHRSNNSKRDYLFVNKIQCKHIPASPSDFLYMMDKLTDLVGKQVGYARGRSIVIGFAETATAIATRLAVNLGGACAGLICTTRETLYKDSSITPDSNVKYIEQLSLIEEHSHAPEHSIIVREVNDSSIIKFTGIGRIYIVDDEITTGNTILNLVKALKDKYNLKDIEIVTVSICNWMNETQKKKFIEHKIKSVSLINGQIRDVNMKMVSKQDGQWHDEEQCDGRSISTYINTSDSENTRPSNIGAVGIKVMYEVNNSKTPMCLYTRHGLNADELVSGRNSFDKIYSNIKSNIPKHVKSIRIIGTEEFMYIPIMVGRELELEGFNVICHASTRSKIDVIKDESSGEADSIKRRYSVPSVYDIKRDNYIYNMGEQTDMIIVMSDTPYRGLFSNFIERIADIGAASKVLGVRL